MESCESESQRDPLSKLPSGRWTLARSPRFPLHVSATFSPLAAESKPKRRERGKWEDERAKNEGERLEKLSRRSTRLFLSFSLPRSSSTRTLPRFFETEGRKERS